MAATSSINTATNATAVLALLNSSITNVNTALGDIGAQAKQIEAHNTFVSKLTDVLEAGIGNLVDADLAKESARLQALQVQQQLGRAGADHRQPAAADHPVAVQAVGIPPLAERGIENADRSLSAPVSKRSRRVECRPPGLSPAGVFFRSLWNPGMLHRAAIQRPANQATCRR